MRYLLAIALCFCCGVPALAGALIDAGHATVVDVIDGDTVLLDTVIDGSKEVRLVGIQAPKLPLGRAGFKQWPLAGKAKGTLESLILGHQVELKFGGRSMDRHGRLLAHLFVEDGGWVQGSMLSAGMARVYSFADNRSSVDQMLKLEKQARIAKRGIWKHPYYRLLGTDELNNKIGTFQLVEGVVFDVATVRGRTYLNFTDDWRQDFTITIDKRARTLFTQTAIDPISYKGKKIRVRGWLKVRNGPMIELTHPEQIELLD